MSRHVALKGEIRNAKKVWLGNLKRPLGRPTCKWEANIEMDLKQVGKLWTVCNCLRIGTSGGLL
jgi:hypothetical protein